MKTIMTTLLVVALILMGALTYANGQEGTIVTIDENVTVANLTNETQVNETVTETVNETEAPVPGCTDTDGGALSYLGGHVNSNGVIYDDYCSGSSVVEYTCVDGNAVAEEMECMRGCMTNLNGYGQCKPTAGGSPTILSEGGEHPVTDVPEFNTLAAIAALGISGVGYVFLRQNKRG